MAYSWENLYLACHNCNGKVPNKSIAVTTFLDSCKASDEEIMQHLTFEDEEIIAKNNSEKGLKTIIDFLRKSFLMLKTKFCHSEQSEESEVIRQILRFAQNDKGFFKALKDFRKKSNEV